GGLALSIFNGTNPNGTWSLYIVDDAGGDIGQFAGGWTLTITSTGPCVTPTPTPTAAATPTAPQTRPPSGYAGPAMPTPTVRAVGVYFPANGKFYAMGGRSADTAGSDFTHPFEYDPASNAWSPQAATYADNQIK